MPHILTKSKYLRFLACPREFWLEYHRPELFSGPAGIEYEHRRQQGYDVERLARDLPVLQPLAGKRTVEYGREFKTPTLYAKADIVVTDVETGEITIYEIKSSASVKDEHIWDVAFQKIAAEATGARVAKTFVVTVNTSYVRNGVIDPEGICNVSDVTADVLERQADALAAIDAAFAYLEGEPAPGILGYCDSKLACVFIAHHFPDLPEYTVFALGNLKQDKRDALIADGILDIRDIPADFKLSDRQRRQVDVARSGEAYIDPDGIKARLNALAYPLHFLDYETFNYAVPHYEGIRPYQQMAFQYSLHTVAEPGGACKHNYFLSDGRGTPPQEMAQKLRDDMGEIGTVIVWSQGFEKTVNKQIGEIFPEYFAFFEEVNEKTFDLRKIFSDLLYMHPSFLGSTSIKKVMPVLAPHLSYKDLDIGDGITASIKWFRMAKWDLDEGEKRSIYDHLCKYCELDTWAMVEIFKFLQAL